MKHHDLLGRHLAHAMNRAIKLPILQLLPISIRQPVSRAERLANISRVTRIRSLFLLFARQDRPIHDRTVRNHFPHARIKRTQQRRSSAKTSADYKDFVSPHSKTTPKRNLAKLTLYSVDHVKNIQMRRPRQKPPAALPSSAIPRIKHPISLRRQKLRERLLARNRRHPIAQNNHALLYSSSRRRQKLSKNVFREPRPKHRHFQPLSPLRFHFCNLTSAICNPVRPQRLISIRTQILPHHPISPILRADLLSQIFFRQSLQHLVINNQQLRPRPPRNIRQFRRRSMERFEI